MKHLRFPTRRTRQKLAGSVIVFAALAWAALKLVPIPPALYQAPAQSRELLRDVTLSLCKNKIKNKRERERERERKKKKKKNKTSKRNTQ